MTQSSSFFHLPSSRRYRLLLFPAALVLRLANWAGVFTPFGVFPEGPDSYFHLRRILAALSHFPFVPDTDRYLNFPDGGPTYWPYGYDIFYAAVVKVLTFGMADDWWSTTIASLVTPVIGALVPMIVFTIAEELGDWRAGLLAGGMTVFLQPLVVLSTVGIIDHHVFEAFFLGLFLLALVRMTRQASDPEAKPGAFRGVAVGLALVGGLLSTTVFPFVIGLTLGLTVLLPLVAGGEARGRLLDGLVRVWWAVTVGLLPFVMFRFFEPSGVNPSLTIGWMAAAAGLIATSLGRSMLSRGGIPFAHRATLAAVVFVLAAGVWLDYRGVITYAAFGNRFVFSSDPIIKDIAESAPVWRLGIRDLIRTSTGLVFLYPFALGWLGWRGLRGHPALFVLAMTSAAVELLAVNQLRFLNLAAVPFCTVLGVAILDGFDAVNRSNRISRGWVRGALAVLLVGAFWLEFPGILNLGKPRAISPEGGVVSLSPTFQWIADHTPPTSPDGSARSDYSIEARWDWGHWLVALGRRPCLGSPITFPWHQRGIRDGAVILVEPPDRALELMRKRRARYILVTPLPLTHFFRLACWDIDTNTVAAVPEAESREKIRKGLYSQLLGRFGVPLGSSSPEGLRHFRLVHESRDLRFPGMERPYVMLFELVPGATVLGRTLPGTKVTVSGMVQTAGGRKFEYADSVTADAAGGFEIILPYPSGVQRYSEVVAPDGFQISVGQSGGSVKVTENDVLTGRTFDLGTLGATPSGK